MSLISRILCDARRSLSWLWRATRAHRASDVETVDAAQTAYRSGVRTTDPAQTSFLAPYLANAEGDALEASRALVDELMTGVTASADDDTYRQRCRFAAWAIQGLPCIAESVAEHPAYFAGLYSLNQGHPYLFKTLMVRLLRSSYGLTTTNKADLFTQLAVAFDLLGRHKRTDALLRHVQKFSQSGTVRPLTTDFALRMLAARCALQGKIASTLILLAEAEPYADAVYGLSSLQADIAWVLAICRHAMVSVTSPPFLLQISVTALSHIAERQPASADIINVDMLMHGLDRGRYGHLSALSCMTTLRIMREAPPPYLDDESLAITFVNTGNAMLGNEELAPEWNLMARKIFQDLVEQIESGKLSSNTEIQFQAAQAYAGIGYSYYNLARTAERGERLATYRDAREYLNHAISLIQQYRWDRWINARVWACAGIVEGELDNIAGMHACFAEGLVAGATHYEVDVESLVNFFNPDEDTRLKYSEALSHALLTNSAILFAKAAVHSIHHAATPLDQPSDLATAYIGSRTIAHRTLINELSRAGRHNEGELAYDLLKENEYNEFTQRSQSEDEISQQVSLTPFELEAIHDCRLGAVLPDLALPEKRSAVVAHLTEAFASLESKLLERIHSRGIPGSLSAEFSVDAITDLRPGDGILRFISSRSSLVISLWTCQGKKQRYIDIDVHFLGSLIFEFRQLCRSALSDPDTIRNVGRRLHEILFSAIEADIGNDVTHLYIEADRLMTSIPFAALHDGNSYLAQRYSFAYLNRIANNKVEATTAPATVSHAAIFACTDLPGEELPGAAREVSAIAAELTRHSTIQLDHYLDRQCTIETFLRELHRPRGGRGLIHLATHASFNPASDATSVLAFSDGMLNVRTLRTIVERSGCDTGLFVLSACGTARQDIDVEGFGSVLLRSGVRMVVSTLWEAYDDSASEFFRCFYANNADQSSVPITCSAVRLAQSTLLTNADQGTPDYGHPAHWAPYIVTTARVDSPLPKT
jgi:CHAT domain-containing protein